MNGGWSYQTAHLPFVVHGPVRCEQARGPPEPSNIGEPDQPQTRRRASGCAASPGEPRSNPVTTD